MTALALALALALARTGGEGRLVWAVHVDRRTLAVMRRARLKAG